MLPVSEGSSPGNKVPDKPLVTQTNNKPGGYTPSQISPYIAAPVPQTPKSMVQQMLDVQYYAPGLRDQPSMVAAIASDPYVSPKEIRTIGAMHQAVTQRLHLESLDPQMQIDVYNNLDPKTQNALKAIGYRPGLVSSVLAPELDDGGVWGWLKGAAAAVGSAYTPDFVGSGLEAMGVPEFLGDAGHAVGGAVSGVADAVTGAGSAVTPDFVGDSLSTAGASISDSALGTGAAYVGNLAKSGGSKIVNGAMYVLSEPQELVFQDLRAFRLLQSDKYSFFDLGDIQSAFNVAGTNGGAAAYDDGYLAKAKSNIGDDELYGLAVEVMSLPEDERADWITRAVKRAGGADGDVSAMTDMYTKLQSSEFGRAMQLVDAAHISVGRMIAQDYGLTDMTSGDFGTVSGAIDLTGRITLDPWLLAGAAGKANLAARYGVTAVEDAGAYAARVDDVFKQSAVIRNWEGAGGKGGAIDLINTIRNSDDPQHIADAVSKLKSYGGLDNPVNKALVEAPKDLVLRNANDVANFVKAGNGQAAVFRGQAAFRMNRFAKKNAFEHFVAEHKPGSVVDWLDTRANLTLDRIGMKRADMGLADNTVDNALEGVSAEGRAALAQQKFKAVGQIVNSKWQKSPWFRASTMLTRLTTHVQVPENGKLLLNGEHAVKQVEALARSFAPKSWTDALVGVFATSNEAGRRVIYKGLLDTLGEAAGVTRTAEGKAWWETVTHNATHGNYTSAHGLDRVKDGDPFALLESDLRPYVSMPDFGMMYNQAQRMGILSKMGGHFTGQSYDWFIQRAFKPSVLLRPALVIRNAGEEVLRHIVDVGGRDYIHGRMVRTHLRSGLGRAKGVPDPMLEDEWRFFRLFTKPAFKTYESVVNAATFGLKGGTKSRVVAKSARQWFAGHVLADLRRGYLTRVYGEATVRRLEDMWDASPRLRRLFARDVLEQSRKAYEGIDAAKGITAGTSREMRRRTTISFKTTGDYDRRAVEGMDGAVRWTQRLDKLAHDAFSAPAFEHLDDRAKAVEAIKDAIVNHPSFERAVASQKLGVDKWASNLYDEVLYHFTGKDGSFLDDLWNRLAPIGDDGLRSVDDDAFDPGMIHDLVSNEDKRPLHVLGQEIIHVEKDTPGLITRLIDSGFDYVGESTNYISRGPLFFSHLIKHNKVLHDTYGRAVTEALLPEKEVAKAHREYARKVITDDAGEPVTFWHGAEVKYDELDPAYAKMDAGPYHVGVEFTTNKRAASYFADPEPVNMEDAFGLADPNFAPDVRGHLHSVWLRQRKMLDVNESLEPDRFEKFVSSFAKHADMPESFTKGILFRAAQDGDFTVNRVYTDVQRAKGAHDMGAVNEAFEAALKSGRYTGFTRQYGGHTITHIIDKDAILADRMPTDVAALRGNKFFTDQINKLSEQRALESTIKYVDNPQVRSQFSVIARNLFPFWRAQEEFYRRWATTFKHSPEAFRKAQLGMMGLEHSGLVQRDDNGHAYFIYPFMGPITEAFLKFGDMVGLNLGNIPMSSAYRGQIRFLNQGIDPNNIQPSVSPILGFPVAVLARLWPEMQPVENAVLGEQGAGRNPFVSLLPTPLRRLGEAGLMQLGGDEWTSQMASAGMSAIAGMEAAGLTPPSDATPTQVDQYLERVRMWTKATLTLRALYGTLAPTPLDSEDRSAELPESLQFEGLRTVDQLFIKMAGEVGYDKAIQMWMKTNPDQVPFTTGTTETYSGAYWKSTRAAGDFYASHRELFKDYPKAAAFLMPQDESGDWDPDVFAIEMANGLRTQKNVGEFYRDLKVSGQLGQYFTSRDNATTAISEAKATGDYDLAHRYEASYQEWRDGFLKMNPLVSEYLADGQARAFDREQLVNDMRSMLKSGDAPKSDTTAVIGNMITSWDNLQKFLDENNGSDTASEVARARARASFQSWVSDYADATPNAYLFYNRTFRWME